MHIQKRGSISAANLEGKKGSPLAVPWEKSPEENVVQTVIIHVYHNHVYLFILNTTCLKNDKMQSSGDPRKNPQKIRKFQSIEQKQEKHTSNQIKHLKAS